MAQQIETRYARIKFTCKLLKLHPHPRSSATGIAVLQTVRDILRPQP
jgi:hypothetical protein